jgi:preprotein translocase subunit SecA
MVIGILESIRKKIAAGKLQKYWERVQAVNSFESTISQLTDDQLKAKTLYFKEQLAAGKTLDDILPEAFAVVREAGKRTLNMRHFDVQILGGIILHEGRISEMKTGEGKTLVATLAVYLNALVGKGVHVVTVNDYLARRDSEWMGKVYTFLGLSVGVIVSQMEPEERRIAYNCDITYATNNELGFDYLRDNMATHIDQIVQREQYYAIVDEVDSILIDEARTPLIISGQIEDSTSKYKKVLAAAKKLDVGKYLDLKKAEEEKHPEEYRDFTMEEKSKHVALTEQGIQKAEKLLGIESLFDIKEMDTAHILLQALKALYLFKLDVDYVLKDGEVVIVDEFTGRLMSGRRYSDGLHQAIEAKENVKIQSESQTLAAITFQNYFRMYKKLAGMTGTALTEADEFAKIYNLAVVEIPTNKPVGRKDQHDVIYKNKMAKFTAIVKEIKERHAKGQPILVGTISIENSEILSGMLTRAGIKHNVLNAKQHAREAEIIKDAGQRGTVTIATNMAGRGTDIVLGAGVTELGGLHVLGTERHESRRIDNQLRGRCGRQGDPGSSRFYISLEDDLMRIFGGQRVSSMMERFNIPEDTPIEHPLITGSIERAQKKVEQYHFSMRKQVLQYDDVMNRQRTTIYALRRKLLMEPSMKDKILEMQKNIIDRYTAQGEAAEPAALAEIFPIEIKSLAANALLNEVGRLYQIKEDSIGSEIMRDIEKMVVLRELDRAWIDHLHNLDVLREGIGLRAYGQQDPLVEYKIEGFKMFQAMLANVEESVCSMLFRVQVVREDQPRELAQPKFNNVDYHGGELDSGFGLRSPLAGEATHRSRQSEEKQQPVHVEKTVGRNDPCPCGSGKKYKKCCGAGKE